MWGLTTLLLFHMPYIISNNVKGFPIISIAARSVCAHLFADRFPLDLLRLVKLLYVMIVQRLICLCKTAKSISWSRRVCVWCVVCGVLCPYFMRVQLQVPSLKPSSSNWSWDHEEERKRQERWQEEQERHLQVREGHCRCTDTTQFNSFND